MREKSKSPDDIIYDGIDDIFDFSHEYISQFEEGFKYNAARFEEKNKLIEKLNKSNTLNQAENEKLQKKLGVIERDLTSYKSDNEEKRRIISEQEDELNKYKSELYIINLEQEQKHIRMTFIRKVSIRIILFILVIICLATVFSELLPEYQNAVNVVVALISFYSCVIPIYRNDWKKYKESMSGIKSSVENNINNGKDVY